MAFLAPLAPVGVVVGAIGGVGVGIAALVRALQTKDLLAEKKSTVANVCFLRKGDHILHKTTEKKNHAIVVNIEGNNTNLVNLIYLDGANPITIVRNETHNLRVCAERGQLIRYTYAHVMFAPESVVERAKYLLTDFPNSISRFEPKIKDSEDFANWCQCGLTFTELFTALWDIRNRQFCSTIRNIEEISVDDHLCIKVNILEHNQHVIVTDKDNILQNMSITYWQDHESRRDIPKQDCKELIKKGQLIRYNYDIAISPKSEDVQRRLKQQNGYFADCDQFATWCKFGKKMSFVDASCLGRARMLGRLRINVMERDVLKSGDHISWSKDSHNHHAIILHDVMPASPRTPIIDLFVNNGNCKTAARGKKGSIREAAIDDIRA